MENVFLKYTNLTGKGEIIASAFLEYMRKTNGRLPDSHLVKLMILMYNRGKKIDVKFDEQKIYRNERSFSKIVQEARYAGWVEEHAEFAGVTNDD